MSTCEVKVLAQNIMDFRDRNLGFEPGTSDLFNLFSVLFLLKKTCGDQTMASNEKK
jgi:hypothetical protein